ncbi:MAG: ferrochelatase [Flavobacteriales bacterium]|jgi:ferrochelatase
MNTTNPSTPAHGADSGAAADSSADSAAHTRADSGADPRGSAATWGLLLVNLGTPDSADTPDVRKYLRQFLMDGRVLDINAVGRAVLVNGIIGPFRSPKSSKAYKKVWMPEGSPLLVYTERLLAGVRERLGEAVQVEMAMRYQSPDITTAMDKFREAGVDRIMIFPLFPHYASSTTGSAMQAVMDEVRERWNVPELLTVGPYYDHPAFINAWVDVAKPILDEAKPDKIVFSYHGVPVRHMTKSDEVGNHCQKKPDCCATLCYANRNCYAAQCRRTTEAVVEALGIPGEKWEQTYQSRLGRDPWLMPPTDDRLEHLPEEGAKNIAVLCPAFTADCLETIEEMGMEGREEFLKAGGEHFALIPCLNEHPSWMNAVVSIAEDYLPKAWTHHRLR